MLLDCVEFMEGSLRPRWRDEAGVHIYMPRVTPPVFPLGADVQKRTQVPIKTVRTARGGRHDFKR